MLVWLNEETKEEAFGPDTSLAMASGEKGPGRKHKGLAPMVKHGKTRWVWRRVIWLWYYWAGLDVSTGPMVRYK